MILSTVMFLAPFVLMFYGSQFLDFDVWTCCHSLGFYTLHLVTTIVKPYFRLRSTLKRKILSFTPSTSTSSHNTKLSKRQRLDRLALVSALGWHTSLPSMAGSQEHRLRRTMLPLSLIHI